MTAHNEFASAGQAELGFVDRAAEDNKPLNYVHFETTPVTSGITGRTILVNYHHTKVAVLPDFDTARLAAVQKDWQAHLEAELKRRNEAAHRSSMERYGFKQIGATPLLRTLVQPCLSATSMSAFACALEVLVQAMAAKASLHLRPIRVGELLVLMWKHKLIVFPAGWIWEFFGVEIVNNSELFYGSISPALSEMMNRTEAYLLAYSGAKSDYRKGARYMRRFFLACGGIEEVGDVDMTALEGFIQFLAKKAAGKSAIVCDMLQALQLVTYAGNPELRSRIPISYRQALRPISDFSDDVSTAPVPFLPDASEWVHLDPIPVTSDITGRTILVNYHDTKYAVLPEFSTARLATARTDWETDKLTLAFGGKRKRLRSHTIHIVAACFHATSRETFAGALDRLLVHRSQTMARGSTIFPGEPTGITNILILLWKHGLLAFPVGEIWGVSTVRTGTIVDLKEEFYGPLAPAMRTMASSSRWGSIAQRVPRVVFLACGGVQEIGDIDANVLAGLVPFAAAAEEGQPRQFPKSVNVLCDQLRAVQLQTYADDEAKLANIPQSYRTVFRPRHPGRRDPQFQWAASLGARVASWQKDVVAYVATLPNRVTRAAEITAFNILLDYVHTHDDVPEGPVEYCRRDYTPDVSFEAYFSQRDGSKFHADTTMRRVGLFLAWLLEQRVMDEDGYISRDYRNPYDPDDRRVAWYNHGQTHRSAIPIRYLRMMREIIEENDYAWPRTIQQDYIEWINPETGKLESVWSPVRALFFKLRLELPLRGLQVRLLDSGEGDPEVFRPDQGGWLPNTGRWAPKAGQKKKPTGFIRRIWDEKAGKHFNGMYITTNKTADHIAGFVETGYEIPWENPVVIDIFTKLRDWQERFNPSQHPMTRAELSDTGLSASDDVALKLEKIHFLFRDPANPAHPMEPASGGRVEKFWVELVAELERRLASRGMTNEDGSPIVLITKYIHGQIPAGTIFDPHSLRVAGLTALAAAGVPLHILSEFVAGHATVLMTLYYQKPGASEITRLLDEAALKMAGLEQRQWAAFLKDQSIDLDDLAAFNSEEGAAAAKSMQSGLWSPMDDGICPNGGTKCGVGGPKIDSRKNVYAPVLGGARNCALCRFFVTGPAYLAGLVAKFNATAGAIREAITRVQEFGLKRRELVKAQLEAEREQRPFDKHRQLVRAEEELAKAEGETDLLSQTWMAQLRLIRRCETLLAKRMAEQKTAAQTNALVLNGSIGDLQVSLESCSEFDLWDRICESSEFFEGIDARLPALRRGRLFDAMLSREGRRAIFATLTDEQLIAVGNEATRLLRARLGTTDLNDLIAGRTTLQALGVEELMDELSGSMPAAPVNVVLHAQAVPALPAPSEASKLAAADA